MARQRLSDQAETRTMVARHAQDGVAATLNGLAEVLGDAKRALAAFAATVERYEVELEAGRAVYRDQRRETLTYNRSLEEQLEDLTGDVQGDAY
jgi:hypothetical protein